VDHDELTIFLFVLEHLALVTAGFVVLLVRMSRTRKTKREEEDRALHGDEQRQVADMRAEMTQMRELMADFLLDMEPERTVSQAEQLREGARVES
jgi:hypothetical protein